MQVDYCNRIRQALYKDQDYYKEKGIVQVEEFLHCIQQEKMNITKLKQLSYMEGIPEDIRGLKPLVWKILLSYMPLDSNTWEKSLKDRRDYYNIYVEDCIGTKEWSQFEQLCDNKNDDYLDDPLMDEGNLKEYIAMRNKWDELEKDIRRTRTEMNFYHQSTEDNKKSKYVYLSRDWKNQKNEPENHRDVLCRILFVYCKTNPGINYTQGMNEILAIIYYVFYNYELTEFQEFAEADTYWCFLYQISTLKDHYLITGNFESHPMKRVLTQYNKEQLKTLPEIYNSLDKLKILPEFYAYRWILTLYCQEFNVAELANLWDAMLCFFEYGENHALVEYLYYLGFGYLFHNRDIIMQSDTIKVVKCQQSSRIDVRDLIYNASIVYKERKKKEIISLF